MIYNVIDRRARPYRWRKIDAIIEATSHDNAVNDTDEQPETDDDVTYDQLENVSLHEAILWAQQQPSAVTLYIYDRGTGTKSVTEGAASAIGHRIAGLARSVWKVR